MDEIPDLSDDQIDDPLLLSLRDRQLRTLFETTLDAIAIADDRGRYLDVNPAACELFGLERNQLLGRCIFEFAESGLDFPQVWQEFQQQEKVRGEFRLVRADGELRIVEYAATANFLPHRHLSVMRDITDRKQAQAQVQQLTQQLDQQVRKPVSELEQTQAQLRASQERLESILNSIEGVVWSIHPETFETIYINSAVEQIFGCSVAEFFANPNLWFEIIHPDDQSSIAHALVKLKKKGKTRTEYRIIRRDGQVRWLSVNSYLVYDETGKPIRIDGIATDISDRIESQSRLEQIARHIPGVIYQFRQRPDGTFHFPYSSEGMREIYGLSPEEVREDASGAFGIIHPDDFNRVSQSILESAEHLTPWYCEYRACLPNGKMLWLVGNATPQREPDGSTLWHGYIRDISDRQIREIALHESETKFATIFDTSPDPAWIATLTEGRCLNVNESFCQFLGATSQEIIGKTCVEIELWDDLADFHRFRQTLVETGKIQNFEVVIRTASRQAKTVLISATVKRLDGQDCIIGMIKDISDRKQAELENWQMQNFLNSIIENIPNMVFVKDADHLKFLRFNKAGEELLGYSKEELLGKSDADFFTSEVADFFIAKDREVLAQGRIVDIPEEQVETIHQGTRILHTKKIPILDELGYPQYLLGISEDITEQKQAEAKLIEITQLQQAILDGANYAIISTDTNGIIKTINAVAQRFLGYSSTEIVDKVTPGIFHDLEEIKQRATELTTELGQRITPGFEVFIAKARLGMIDEHEWSYIRQDGSRFPVQLSITALRDQEGTITGFLGIASDISERKQAEAQLQEISERLSMALKSGKIGCWEWDIAQNKLIWDDRIYEIYGINKNSDTPLTYDIWKESLHPDDREPLETLVGKTLLGQAELDTEFRSVHSDGSIHFIKAFGILQRDIEGNPQKLIGVNFDISEQQAALRERKEAENKLHQNEQKYHQILDAITDMVLVKGSKSRIVWANKAFRDYYAMTNEQLQDMIDAPFNEPDYTLQYIRDDAYVFETGQSLEIEEPVTRYDGKVQVFNTIKSVIRNEADEKILTVGVSRDITEQQAALHERKRQEQALRLIVEGTAAKTGEEFFKTCVQYLAQVLEVRYALIAEFANPEKSIGQTLAFWAGDKFGDNFTYNLAGRPCENFDSNTEVCRYPNSVQYLFPEDDSLVTLQAESYAGLPIIDAVGNHLGLLKVMDTKPMVKDLEMQSVILKIFATRAGAEMERMQAEATVRQSEIQLRQQAKELEITLKKLQNTQIQLIQAEKMSSLGQLVAGVAHEINNPVSFIYGNIEHASDYISDLTELIRLYQTHDPNPSPPIAQFIQNIDLEYLISDFSNLLKSMKNGATRIQDIVKSLRTFSRLDEATFKAIDIHENINSTLVILQNRLNYRAGKSEIRLTKNYGQLPLIECHGGLLNQVFMNLLVNAIDAIEYQRERLESMGEFDYLGEIIITTAIASENQVLISIQDNGCGMSAEVKAQIFNPFFTTKPIGKGTGMGLATSYQIIKEQHQGSISVNSTLGEGTEFAIALSIKAS